MFNFDVSMAGHEKVTDAGRATTCRRKCKALCLQTKVSKMKELPKTWVLIGKQFEHSGRLIEQKHCSQLFRKTESSARTLKVSIEHGPDSQ